MLKQIIKKNYLIIALLAIFIAGNFILPSFVYAAPIKLGDKNIFVDYDGFPFNLINQLPGMADKKILSVDNGESFDLNLTLKTTRTSPAPLADDLAEVLTLTIDGNTYPLSYLFNHQISLALTNAGDGRDYEFKLYFDKDAGNGYQNQNLTFDFEIVFSERDGTNNGENGGSLAVINFGGGGFSGGSATTTTTVPPAEGTTTTTTLPGRVAGAATEQTTTTTVPTATTLPPKGSASQSLNFYSVSTPEQRFNALLASLFDLTNPLLGSVLGVSSVLCGKCVSWWLVFLFGAVIAVEAFFLSKEIKAKKKDFYSYLTASLVSIGAIIISYLAFKGCFGYPALCVLSFVISGLAVLLLKLKKIDSWIAFIICLATVLFAIFLSLGGCFNQLMILIIGLLCLGAGVFSLVLKKK